MKRAPRSRQRHDLYAKYHDYDSEISDLLGECGLIVALVTQPRCAVVQASRGCMGFPTIQAVYTPAVALVTKADLVAPLDSIFGPKFAVSRAMVAAGAKAEYQHLHPSPISRSLCSS